MNKLQYTLVVIPATRALQIAFKPERQVQSAEDMTLYSQSWQTTTRKRQCQSSLSLETEFQSAVINAKLSSMRHLLLDLNASLSHPSPWPEAGHHHCLTRRHLRCLSSHPPPAQSRPNECCCGIISPNDMQTSKKTPTFCLLHPCSNMFKFLRSWLPDLRSVGDQLSGG